MMRGAREGMATPPTGAVTFLFTDIEGSTRRWEEQPEAMRQALARHDEILRESIETRGGYVFKTMGDAFYASFATASDALRAAVDGQRTLAEAGWFGAVRMALHAGTADERDGDYFGPPLNRVDRIRAGSHGGQILVSAATARIVMNELPPGVELRDLGLYRLRGLAEPERIYQAAVLGLQVDFPPLTLPEHRPTTLPVPTTSLVGREAEIERIAGLLGSARLLTLTGPGGTGKTRLAIAVAERVHRYYADGAVFVDLSPISDSSLVAPTIAQALGVRERDGGTVIESLQSFVHEKRLLLILDNFEQVVEAAPLLRDLLVVAPHLTILVTSRMVLRLAAEQEELVLPLPLPERTARATLEGQGANAGVRLFVERARDRRPDFALTVGNVGDVARICTELDGLPLAIELAAARIKMLPPRAILDRLDQRLTLLADGVRDLPDRQRTLRAAIQWSYDLLGEPEKRLFRRLAVFSGGFTIGAAEAVCSDERGVSDVMSGIAQLVDASLLYTAGGEDHEPRVMMLETLRSFAHEQLEESGELNELRRHHANYFASLAMHYMLQFVSIGPPIAEYTALPDANVQREHIPLRVAGMIVGRDEASFRAALDWSVLSGNVLDEACVVGALTYFWWSNGLFSEGREKLDSVLSRAPDGAEPTLLSSLFWCVYFMGVLGDYAEGLVRAEQGHVLAQRMGNERYARLMLNEQSIAHICLGNYSRALALLDECERRCREAGDNWNLALVLIRRALVRAAAGDMTNARSLAEEGLGVARAAGEYSGLGFVLLVSAQLALHMGDTERAEQLIREDLSLLNDSADAWAVSHGLIIVAGLALAHGRPDCAARLLGAVEAALDELHAVLMPWFRPDQQRLIEDATRKLGERFEAIREEGRATSLEDAIVGALNSLNSKKT
jgi:predicted ATPase/class 3 adenylate cyclase